MASKDLKLDAPETRKAISGWIQQGLGYNADEKMNVLDFMDAVGFDLCEKKEPSDNFPGFNSMTTSQIRNVFTEIKRIQVKAVNDIIWKTEQYVKFLLLKPKVAYTAARVLNKTRNSKIAVFRKVFDIAHSAVIDQVHFENFCQLMEGILAYHKVYGGKD